MKETNDRVKVELEHAVTGNMIQFAFSEHSVPAQSYLSNRVENLRREHEQLKKKHNLPEKSDGTIDYKQIDDDDIVARLSEINRKIIQYQMDSVCCIMKPVEPLPPNYETKRELIEECITSHEIIPMIMNFFSKHSGNITVLPADGTLPIRFRKPNGESFDPFPEWTNARRKKSSASATSSTD